MTKLYRVLGKRGRITIPYEIRQRVGFSYNDVLSFTEAPDGRTVTVKREKICDNCSGTKTADKEAEMTLEDFLDSLSAEQQRVALARALVNRPNILLADEPTGALDSHTSREVLGMLQDLHGQGHTVVLITHDNSIAVQADRIIRLEDGQVVYDGDSRAPEAIVQPTLNFEPAEQEGNK